jgi:hemoglobin-like flavoprotein
MKKQQHMLHASLYMVMLASQGNEAAEIYLKQVAAKHSRQQLDIAHHLYDLWLASLLASVTIHDPYWNDSIETAWRAVMTKGVSYMQTHYDT